MNHLCEAIAIHNEGASLLQEGKTVESMHLFRSAMTILKDAAVQPDQTEPKTPPTAKPVRHESPCAPLVDAKHEGILAIFSRPLVFPTVTAWDAENTSVLRNTLSSYAVFNLALACHVHGLATGKDAPLERARHLYHIIVGTRPVFGPQKFIPGELLHSLAYNNLAHVYYHWCDYEESFNCVLECAEQIGHSKCLEFLTEDEAQDILLNGMLMDLPSVASAA